VWLDCLLTNVDRTARNTNMLIWNKELWLIDHGAALYFHHSWTNWREHANRPFAQVKDHVLLPFASELEKVTGEMVSRLTPQCIRQVVNLVPDEWLGSEPGETPGSARDVYAGFLETRIANPDIFLKEAMHARATII
jgi:hypothetical protein